MKATGDTSTLQWLLVGVLLTGGHKTGHLVLSKLDLTATEGREGEVSDLVLVCGGRHGEMCGVSWGYMERRKE